MSHHQQFHYEEEKRGFFSRFGFVIGIVAVAGLGTFLFSQMFSGKHAPVRKESEIVMIKPVAPPPPPPPPPPPQQEPQRQMEEQTQVTQDDMKPAEQPAEDNTPSLGTGVTGNGPGDGFGLGGHDRGYGGGRGGGSGGSRFSSYFREVVGSITDALGRNPVTRSANFDVKIRVWSDATGRITRVRLMNSSGDQTIDQALKTTALVGQQLPDIPDGMRMPIELRLNLRRPN